jgi:hypothetical protein
MEADLVEIQEATEAFIVQRTLLGRPRLFLPDAVVDWNGREWTTRPNATALLALLSKIAHAASYDVLRGLLELCVHWLSPGNTGATPGHCETSAARIPAQDWTTRQDTGAHWTDCTDERPTPKDKARTAAPQPDGFEKAEPL